MYKLLAKLALMDLKKHGVTLKYIRRDQRKPVCDRDPTISSLDLLVLRKAGYLEENG